LRSYAGAAGGVIRTVIEPHHQRLESVMTDRTVHNLPAATYDDAVRCLFAIELSKSSWLVAVHTPLADKISRHTVTAGDGQELIALMERVAVRVGRETGRKAEIVSCYEAGYDGFWLHRLLEAHGVRNDVIDPASLQIDRRARRAKTDRIDAERMLRSLMAHLRGEPKVWSVVRVPSVAEEDGRRLHRERDRLVTERVMHVNRIKGLCALHGIYDYAPLRRERWAQLDALRTAPGDELPAQLKAELKRELRRLDLVMEMITALEAERDAMVAEKTKRKRRTRQPAARAVSCPQGHVEKIRRLHELRSIGPEFATVLVGEVFYRHFDNRRQLGSYLGFTPSPFQSGRLARDQGISKAGNAKARTTCLELSWLWLRYQPDSDLSIWFRTRVGTAKGRVRRIAIVAMARKLIIALWRYLESAVVPKGAVFKAA
jgi:transposase